MPVATPAYVEFRIAQGQLSHCHSPRIVGGGRRSTRALGVGIGAGTGTGAEAGFARTGTGSASICFTASAARRRDNDDSHLHRPRGRTTRPGQFLPDVVAVLLGRAPLSRKIGSLIGRMDSPESQTQPAGDFGERAAPPVSSAGVHGCQPGDVGGSFEIPPFNLE